MLESLFNKVEGLRPATLLKKRLQHRCFPVMFFCEYCEIFKNIYFVEHLPTAAFVLGTHAIEYQNINEKNRMRYFLKNIFWSIYFPVTTNCKRRHSRVFFIKAVLKISSIFQKNIPSKCKVTCNLV